MFSVLVHCRLCNSDYVYAYLHNDDAPEVANPETEKEDRLRPEKRNNVHSRSSTRDEQNSEMCVPRKIARTATKSTEVPAAADNLCDRLQNVEQMSFSSVRWNSQGAASSAASSQESLYSNSTASDSQSSFNVQIDIGKEDFLLHPGSFRVLLCVDNQEFYTQYASFSFGSH